MKNRDKYLRRIDERYFGSRLAEGLKTRRLRRNVVGVSVLGLVLFGYLVGYTVWTFIAPETTSTMASFLRALFWIGIVSVIQIEPLLVLSIRSAIAWPGQPYDERQQQLNTRARSESRPLELAFMGAAILTGLGMLIAIQAGYLPFSNPLYGGIPIFAGIGVVLFSLAKNAPNLLLAWQLPDEPYDDSEVEND